MWCYSVHEDDDDGDDDDNDDGDEHDEDDDVKNKNDGEDDDVVTVLANACVAPNLKHPETPQEPQTLKDLLSDPSRPPDNHRPSRMCQHILYSKNPHKSL